MKTVFLRALEASDKADALRIAIREPVTSLGRQRFEVDAYRFAAVPRSPFAYWVSDAVRQVFKNLPAFEAEGRTTKQGLATADDFRFIRGWWAVPPRDLGKRWVSFAKGGQFSPFYSDIHLVVNWEKSGREIKNNLNERGTVRSNVWMLRDTASNYFLRPGLTWPIKNRFSLKPWPLPAGCIFAHVGSSAFVEGNDTDELSALHTLMSSSIFTALARIMAGWNFEVGIIQRTPLASPRQKENSELAKLSRLAWSLKRRLDTSTEVSHAFTLPAQLQAAGETPAARADTWAEYVRNVEHQVAEIQGEIDAQCFDLYGIGENDRGAISQGFIAHVGELTGAEADINIGADADADADNQDDDSLSEADAASLSAKLVAWAAAVAFGRFDVRLATGVRPLPAEPGPFDALPTCSPGMLTGNDGLPLMSTPTGYPLPFPEDGMLVDDRGHTRDLTTAVRMVFDEIFKSDADAWWNEVATLLDPTDHDLRAWLASSFFEHHLKHYSKSRRRAPILWQLSVPSGRYSIWLYAHRLTRDRFFQIQNELVTPKLAHEERQLASLIESAGANPSAIDRKQIAAQESFVGELRVLLDEVKRVAPLWNPILDDGVALTMAPLWRLVPQYKAWQKELKSKWDELAAGKYDWAHIAMHLWPERVVPKCATDRSVAIAHGLEDIFWAETNDGKSKPQPAPKHLVDELVRERTSVAVKAALKELTEASTPNGSKAKARRASS